MSRFVLKNTFIKIYIYHFLIFFYKNKELKLGFGDHVGILNNFEYGRSIFDGQWLGYTPDVWTDERSYLLIHRSSTPSYLLFISISTLSLVSLSLLPLAQHACTFCHVTSEPILPSFLPLSLHTAIHAPSMPPEWSATAAASNERRASLTSYSLSPSLSRPPCFWR